MGPTRREVLFALPAVGLAASGSRGRAVPTAASRYADPSTEFAVTRLTDPMVESRLPSNLGRVVSKKGQFAVYSSSAGGSMEVYRIDLKSGAGKQLTETESLDPLSVTMTADEKAICYLDGGRLFTAPFSTLKPREVYRAAAGYELVPGIGVSEDSLYAVLVERKGDAHRLRLVRLLDGMATTLAEASEPMSDPVTRPKRASVMYRRADGVWLANYDTKENRRLKTNSGRVARAHWSPDGRAVLYLNVPAEERRLISIREHVPDANEDRPVGDTTQFASFAPNADATMFVGASGSKASPHVLLLSRAVKREFTLCEHRASDPQMVQPVFSPDSQKVLFCSDQHGKPAIYMMPVDKIVTETDN